MKKSNIKAGMKFQSKLTGNIVTITKVNYSIEFEFEDGSYGFFMFSDFIRKFKYVQD